jgi:hypothetical protein
MVVAKIPVAVEDPYVAKKLGLALEEYVNSENEKFFLDGPVGERVAVVDRNPTTGKIGSVAWSARDRRYLTGPLASDPQAMAVSVFGIVLETLSMFERPDILGGKIAWQFGSPQLLIVPNAGEWENAAYDRYSRSLQFFSFMAGRRRIFTALSRDIVAHETGHAVLDALAPALYDALNPQALALHEAIADFTAIVMALQSRSLQQWLVRERGASLEGDIPTAQIGEQFGRALEENRPLRDANSKRRLDQAGNEPHDLCEVLVAAVWRAMVQLHEHALKEARAGGKASGAAPAEALGISSRRIARILFRALDYLPPAETTFADYARALLQADTVAYPDDETGYRAVLAKEFESRRICPPEAINVKTNLGTVKVGLDELVESDWAAYRFVERERPRLRIAADVPFRLFPRRDVKRRYWVGGGKHETRREVVLQVTWEQQEPNHQIPSAPRSRSVFRGTTLVLGAPDRAGNCPILSCLTSDRGNEHANARNEALRKLVGEDRIVEGDAHEMSRARPLAPVAFAHVTPDTIRVRGTSRLLHLARAR